MATDFVTEVMVRLTAEDFGVLVSIQRPGEARAHAYLRVAREAVLPPTILLRYRKPPLFRDWLQMGPLSPLTADTRAQALIAQRFEVEAVEVAPRGPAPAWPSDEPEDRDPELHRPLGVTLCEPEELGIRLPARPALAHTSPAVGGAGRGLSAGDQ